MPKKEEILHQHFSELGKKGGAARAEKLSAKKRSAIARKAALARLAKMTPEQRSEMMSKVSANPKPRRAQ
jgi:hypothetical protein